MRRVILAALLAAYGCAGRSDQPVDRLFDQARHALRRGELAAAEQLADRALAVEHPDAQSAWRVRLLRAEILVAERRLQEVQPLLDQHLPDEAAFETLRGRQRYVQAAALVAQNRLPDALGAVERAAASAGGSQELRFDIDALEGQIRLRLGEAGQAESKLNALVVAADAAGDHYHQALALNDLGMGRRVRNRWDEALSRFERVLALTDIQDLTIYAAALNNAGICYARLGQFDRALATQKRAVEVFERRGKRAEYELALGTLGNTYVMQGDPRSALPYLRKAFEIANGSNIHADAVVWAGNLASAYSGLREWDAAESFNRRAVDLNAGQQGGAPGFTTLNAAEIAAGRGQFEEANRLFAATIAASEGEPHLRWTAHAGLAQLAVTRHQPKVASAQFEAALDIIESTRADLSKTDYKLSYLTRLIDFYRAYVDTLVDQGDIERALAIAESSRGRVLAERQGVSAPARVSATAFRRLAERSGTVLLAYWLAPRQSYLWIVRGEGITCIKLPPAKVLEALVAEHQAIVANVIADPLAAKETAGDRLYQLLVAPAGPFPVRGPHAHGAPRVVIVPDGALHSINFETLPVDGPRRHYWIEDAEIEIAPSLAMVASPAQPARPAGSLLLIGDAEARPDYPGLRYASAEMAGIARHFDSSRVASYQGARATPSVYRDGHPERFAFVHFTAHATANTESPLDSAVILSGGGDREYKLYARDVAAVPLSADLVTVSSCRSAGERRYSGEGLIGFSWAFLRAGASRVIAGLWDVDDRSTSELMERLYGRLVMGDTPAQALRQAKLDLIAQHGRFAAPYNWAPFELFTLAI